MLLTYHDYDLGLHQHSKWSQPARGSTAISTGLQGHALTKIWWWRWWQWARWGTWELWGAGIWAAMAATCRYGQFIADLIHIFYLWYKACSEWIVVDFSGLMWVDADSAEAALLERQILAEIGSYYFHKCCTGHFPLLLSAMLTFTDSARFLQLSADSCRAHIHWDQMAMVKTHAEFGWWVWQALGQCTWHELYNLYITIFTNDIYAGGLTPRCNTIWQHLCANKGFSGRSPGGSPRLRAEAIHCCTANKSKHIISHKKHMKSL